MVDDSPGADKSKKKYLQTSCLGKTLKRPFFQWSATGQCSEVSVIVAAIDDGVQAAVEDGSQEHEIRQELRDLGKFVSNGRKF